MSIQKIIQANNLLAPGYPTVMGLTHYITKPARRARTAAKSAILHLIL